MMDEKNQLILKERHDELKRNEMAMRISEQEDKVGRRDHEIESLT